MTIQHKETKKWSNVPQMVSPIREKIKAEVPNMETPFKEKEFKHTPHLLNTMLV